MNREKPGADDDNREPSDRDPGAHADYYKGGDYPRARLGPEGGFEERGDFRRSERHADQGQSAPAEREDDPETR